MEKTIEARIDLIAWSILIAVVAGLAFYAFKPEKKYDAKPTMFSDRVTAHFQGEKIRSVVERDGKVYVITEDNQRIIIKGTLLKSF